MGCYSNCLWFVRYIYFVRYSFSFFVLLLYKRFAVKVDVPYFLIYFFLLIFCSLGSVTKNRFFLICVFILFSIFSGFRYYVGVDYVNYVKIYNLEEGYGSRELGFNLILDFLRYIGASYQFMFFIMAVVMQILVYNIIKRYNYSVWISVFIYYCISPFYIATFNGMRQYLAIAVFIVALKYIEQKKIFKYIVSLLLGGFFFHESILVFIPLYYILNKTISIKGKLLAFLLTIAGSLAIDKLISYTPYIVYLTRDRETHISSFTYIFAGISILFIIFWNKLNSFKSKLIMENMNLFCFLSLLVVLLQSNGVLIQMTLRMNSYFFFVYIILVPAVISSIKNVHMRIGMYFSLHLVLLLYLVRTICFNGHLYDLVPYSMNFNLFK